MFENDIMKEQGLLIPKLMSDEKQFHNFFRMNESLFDFLLTLIEADLTKKDTNMRYAVSAKEKLALALRYLATGMCDIFYIRYMSLFLYHLCPRPACSN